MTMDKVTFRQRAKALESATELWEREEAVFDSKSEFYRFATEFALTELLEDYKPSSDFSMKLDEVGDVEGADEVVAIASEPYFEAYDYANSIVRTLEDESVPAEDRIQEVLDRTYEFIESEFPDSYLAQDLE